ncbi:hypothetical protein BKL49_11475 [Rodentibacter myodis]|uniref:Uncharacterized protein n=2 Tax=Rodentibacter myodis TaxID=1907939 RepID=A0A1V3JFH6_9PAST|nr:hypothetical protein BKL49_11475 [Rodentibacter myodis]
MLLFGYGVYWYFYKSSFYVAETDYSKTQWRTFYGKKTPGYLPEFWVTYSTNADDPNCQESFNMTFEGKPVARKQYKEFKAEEENNGKTYIIRYPANYWIGQCEYRSYGGKLYLEEKSDDPRLNQEPYNNKNQYYRFTLLHGGDITNFSLRPDSYLSERKIERQSPIYLNQPKYDIFCFKKVNFLSGLNESEPKKIELMNWLSCDTYEENKKDYLGLFLFYTEEYWNEHKNIEINLRISKDNYCVDNSRYLEECLKYGYNILSEKKYKWNIKKEWFDDFYDEVITNDRP